MSQPRRSSMFLPPVTNSPDNKNSFRICCRCFSRNGRLGLNKTQYPFLLVFFSILLYLYLGHNPQSVLVMICNRLGNNTHILLLLLWRYRAIDFFFMSFNLNSAFFLY